MRLRKFLILFSLCFIVGCGGEGIKIKEVNPSELIDTTPYPGGEISIPLTNPDGFNPLLTNNESYFYFSKLLFDSLFTVDNEGKVVPQLAEHYEYSVDGHTLSVTLKENLTWQDGQPLTAYDVAATFNAMRHLPGSSPYGRLLRQCVGVAHGFSPDGFGRAVVFDDRNVDFQFDKPYKNAPLMLTFPILPSHLYTEEQMMSHEDFQLIGSGAYRLDHIDPNQEIVLQKDPNYSRKAAYMDTIRGKILHNEEDAENALRTGEVNVATPKGYDWDQYKDHPKISVEEFETGDMEILALNTEAPIFQGEKGKLIRQAISRGINKQRMIDSLYLGKATEVSNLFPGAGKAEHQSKVYYNLEAARELLMKAGYQDGEDGLLQDNSGNHITLAVTTNSFQLNHRIIVDLIVDDLRGLGIDAHTAYQEVDPEHTYTQEEIVEQWGSFYPTLQRGEFQAALVGVQTLPDRDPSPLLYSGAIGNTNISRFHEKSFDDFLEKMNLGVDEPDPTPYNNTSKRFVEESPYVPLFTKKGALLKDNRLKGRIHPSSYDLYGGLREVFIPKELH